MYSCPNAVVFGQIIRRLRLERGWTIAQLARESEMHPNYLANMEKGRQHAEPGHDPVPGDRVRRRPGRVVSRDAQQFRTGSLLS